MSNRNHLYLTLPSDSSGHIHGKQKTSNYITELAKTLHLDTETWELGLAEISYPRTWPNCVGCEVIVFNPLEDTILNRFQKVAIPELRFDDGGDLVEEVGRKINRVLGAGKKSKIKLEYDRNTKKVTVKTDQGYAISLNRPLSNLLGFGDNDGVLIGNFMTSGPPPCTSTNDKQYMCDTVVSPKPVSPDENLKHLYVYSDITEYQLVGHSYTPLLRIIADDPKKGERHVTITYHDVHYVGLQRTAIDRIRIRLCDEFGQDISFLSGKVIVKLHAKRRQ